MKFIKLFLLLTLLGSPLLTAREQVNINLSNLAIEDFVKLIAKVSKKNILVNHKLSGTVNLVTSTPVYDDEVLGILVSVLETKGFTLVQNGSIYEVVRSTEAAKSNVPVLRPGLKAKGSMMVTQAIQVRGENVDIVAAKVRYLISKTAKLMTMKESNTMLVTDYPGNIETIKKAVADLTRTTSQMMKIVPVVHADLKQLHAQLSEIAKNLFNPKVQTETVTVLLNKEVNGLILIGNASNVGQLEAVIAKLDREQNLEEEVQIINLKNSDAKNVLASLNEIVSKQTYADPTMKPNISANEEINSVIMVGNPTVIKSLRRIIEELDKEKYQVYVQARIVEINNNDSEAIGLKYGLEGGIANSSGLYTFAGNFGGSSVTLSQTVAGYVAQDLIDSLGPIDQILTLGAALDFLQSKGASRTVSNPSILCVNNQESSIYVGKTLSVQTGSSVSTGAVTTNTYKREDVGLTLKIKPRVSSNEKVTLDVETVLENIIGSDANDQPITTKQNVVTQSILRHGESIIIGGLVKSYETETESKVPLLGHIPLLGELFTHRSNEEQQDNLLVILTPYVIDKSAELSQLQRQLGELGRVQQVYNSEIFPVVEGETAPEPASKPAPSPVQPSPVQPSPVISPLDEDYE
jgi:general secretion pathway protein D